MFFHQFSNNAYKVYFKLMTKLAIQPINQYNLKYYASATLKLSKHISELIYYCNRHNVIYIYICRYLGQKPLSVTKIHTNIQETYCANPVASQRLYENKSNSKQRF